MSDKQAKIISEQVKETNPLRPDDLNPQQVHKPVLVAREGAKDLLPIVDKVDQVVRLLTEVGEYVEKIAPKYKRIFDDTKMTISDMGVLLQSPGGMGSEVNRVFAPMPGVIMRCDKKVGEKVRKGDVVVILEAMKMENLITAPAGGKVVSLRCHEGQKVAKGSVLAVIN